MNNFGFNAYNFTFNTGFRRREPLDTDNLNLCDVSGCYKLVSHIVMFAATDNWEEAYYVCQDHLYSHRIIQPTVLKRLDLSLEEYDIMKIMKL